MGLCAPTHQTVEGVNQVRVDTKRLDNADHPQVDNLEPPTEVEKKKADPSESFSKVIQKYQDENAMLKQELETREAENKANCEQKTKQNEAVMNELNEMRELLEKKDIALAKGRVEAALRSTATKMRAVETKTRLCFKGNLQYRPGFSKAKKAKWIEVYVFEPQADEFQPGYVMLTYSDTKDSLAANRVQVLEVISNKVNSSNVVTLSLKVSSEGIEKELEFICDSQDEKKRWTEKILDALDEVQIAFARMFERATLTIEISKQKIGIRVEGKPIPENGYDVKSSDVPIKSQNTTERSIVKSGDNLSQNADAGGANEEGPCALFVTNILDEDLRAKGLQKNFVLRSINDIRLIGKTYTEQITLLMETKKPYKITFIGRKFQKKKAVQENAYVSILKELVGDEDNAVKRAFEELIKGTKFEIELNESDNRADTITALLGNQRRLMALLQNLPSAQEMEL